MKLTNEEKQLLLKDLCARLPYGVKMWFPSAFTPIMLDEFILNVARKRNENFKPYLRPMSSMTEEEKAELQNLINEKLNYGIDSENERSPWVLHNSIGIKKIKYNWGRERFYFNDMNFIYDWLNTHHFDYRELIPMGLALEAPEGMYNNTNNT